MFSIAQKEKLFRLVAALYQRFFGVAITNDSLLFIQNLSWAFLGGIFSAAFLFVLNILGARFLGPVEYGKFQFVVTVAQFLVVPIVLGLSTASTQYIASAVDAELKERTKNTVITTVLLLSLFIPLVFMLFVAFLVYGVEISLEQHLLYTAAFFASALGIYQLNRAVLQGFNRIKEVSVLDFSISLCTLFLFGLGIFFDTSYLVLGVPFIAGYLLYGVIVIIRVQAKPYFSREIFEKNIVYGIYAILGGLTGFFLTGVDKIFIKFYQGNEVLGVYSIYLLASSVLFLQLIQIFITVFFPAASKKKDKTEIFFRVKKMENFLFFGSLFTSFFTITLVLFMMGSGYQVNFWYVFLFSLNVGIMMLYQVKMWLLNSDGLSGVRQTVKGVACAGFLNTFFGFLLIPKEGILGALIASILSGVFFYFYLNQQLKNII